MSCVSESPTATILFVSTPPHSDEAACAAIRERAQATQVPAAPSGTYNPQGFLANPAALAPGRSQHRVFP